MTTEEAIEFLRKRGWCYESKQPYTGWTRVMIGPRLESDSYGKFPSGWVKQVVAEGDGLVDAVEQAMKKENVHAA